MKKLNFEQLLVRLTMEKLESRERAAQEESAYVLILKMFTMEWRLSGLCVCGRWLHEECIDSIRYAEKLCSYCVVLTFNIKRLISN